MSPTLTVSRELYVPRELVFEVWTQPDHVVGWYPPASATAPRVDIDLRPGGRFDIGWQEPGGDADGEAGEFLEVAAPEGFRCRIEVPGGAGPASPLVRTVTLADLGGACRIEILEEGLPGEAQQTTRRQAWKAALDRLEAYFSAI